VEQRRLGRSGLDVSVLGLGCNNFGRRIDQAQTAAVVHKALDLGVTLFDTADVYGSGLSEEYLGKALDARRHDAIIATKFGFKMGEGALTGGGSRRYVTSAAEASLRRLGTDFIDVYQMHLPDARTPIEETLRALDDLVHSGKVRTLGCSNFAGWQVVDAHWVARSEHLSPFVSAQNHYNLLDRRVERELVPACNACGLGILPYFPLASGFLTGKYRKGEAPAEGTRLANAGPAADRVLTARNFETLAALDAFAQKRDRKVLDLAIGWLASQPHVPSVIAGATRPEQVERNARAAEWRLAADERVEVDALTQRKSR
jgi:aryl-alcohol dehydrogenase-like predicted oxidoreductase